MVSSDAAAATAGYGTKADSYAESWKVSGRGPAADPHAVLLAGADEFAAAVRPISVPEAGRELLVQAAGAALALQPDTVCTLFHHIFVHCKVHSLVTLQSTLLSVL